MSILNPRGIKNEIEYGVEHDEMFTGSIWYVHKTLGDDTNSGMTPHVPFETIGAAILAAAIGDAIAVGYGTYVEASLNLNKAGLELWFKLGAVLAPATGTGLTISAPNCKIRCDKGTLLITPAALQTGLIVTAAGTFCYINDARVSCGSSANLGFDISGPGSVLGNCRCSSPLVAAFKVQGSNTFLDKCLTGGDPADTSIGYWITNSVDKTRMRECSSEGHANAGLQIDAGCTSAVLTRCTSGAGDGPPIDNGDRTVLDLRIHDSQEEHEDIYPIPNGEGTAGDPITVQSQVNDETGADDTKDYWGDCAVIVPVSTFANGWSLKGVNIYATTPSDDQRFALYRIVSKFSAIRSGGLGWNAGVTDLTVDDASDIQPQDLWWVMTPGYKPNGEIVRIMAVVGSVVTIARQTENSGRTGLHWNHTTGDPGNEKMYLVWRDEQRYHTSDFDYSASGARDFTSMRFQNARRLHGGDGLVARMINGTDGANSLADLSIIWSE